LAENDFQIGSSRTCYSSGSQLYAAVDEDPGLRERGDRCSFRVLGEGWLLIPKHFKNDISKQLLHFGAAVVFCIPPFLSVQKISFVV